MTNDPQSAQDAPKDTFYIGLAMAGAISAGAYSGGVFDFLMEALEEWQKAKDDPARKDTVPKHKVVIPVMSGASAGGVTGVVGMIALADAASGPLVTHNYAQVGAVGTRLPLLYKAWVTTPKFVDPAGGSDLLGKGDLTDETAQVTSLLDTTSLRNLLNEATTVETLRSGSLPYLASNLHLFLTHTNLRGVPYKIGFRTDPDGNVEEHGYAMLNHADRRHYVLEGVGGASFNSQWAGAYQDVTLLAAGLGPNPPSGSQAPWRRLGEAALGTAGFPVGLRAVEITDVTVENYDKRQWPIDRRPSKSFTLPTNFPEALSATAATRVDYVTVDGGVTDNEPFQFARWTLMDNPPNANARDAHFADRAVIMIDPFPEAPEFDKTLSMDIGLFTVIRRLLPVLKDQARFKPEELAAALDPDVFSRYLISPRRRVRRSDPTGGLPEPPERFPLATGLLGGFGGFLDEEFRAHDYQLGRLNCFLFLRDHFALPVDENSPGSKDSNQLLGAGYDGLTAAQRAPFLAGQAGAGPRRDHQIIPLVGEASKPPTPPIWPRVDQKAVDDLVKRAMQRAELVLDRLKKQKIKGVLGRWLAGLGWLAWGRGKLENVLRWTVTTDLIKRDQLQGDAAGKPEADRKVIAALADPAYDLRTTRGIAAESELSETEVTAILARYDAIVHRQLFPTKDKGQTYTLKARKPNQFWTLPYVKEIPAAFAGDLVID